MSRSFAGVRALDAVTLELHRHEVVGLIGPNGAGKSTLVNVLTGFDTPTSGTVELADRDVTGSAAIDGVATAIRRSGGSTNGATLAARMEKFTKVPTLSGLVSFSTKYHSVFGRQYRVIKIHNNKARYVGAVRARVVPNIG